MAELQQAASLCAEVVPRSGCGCTLCSKQVARCALSIRAAVLETYQYRCSKSADTRALSAPPRCFFIKFSVKENLKRTANRIVYVKSNLTVRLALSSPPRCFFIKFSDKENLKRTANRIKSVVPIHPVRPARCRGTAPLGVEVLPRSGCGGTPRTGCGGIPRSGCGGIPRSGCGGTPRSGCGGIPRSGCSGIPCTGCGCIPRSMCIGRPCSRCPLSRAGMANRQTWSYRFNFVFCSLAVLVGRQRNYPERYN